MRTSLLVVDAVDIGRCLARDPSCHAVSRCTGAIRGRVSLFLGSLGGRSCLDPLHRSSVPPLVKRCEPVSDAHGRHTSAACAAGLSGRGQPASGRPSRRKPPASSSARIRSSSGGCVWKRPERKAPGPFTDRVGLSQITETHAGHGMTPSEDRSVSGVRVLPGVLAAGVRGREVGRPAGTGLA